MPAESSKLPEFASRTVNRRGFMLGAAGAAAGLAFPDKLFAYVNRATNSKTVAFAQPDTTFTGYPLLLHGAKQEASKRGYEVLQSHANQQLGAQVAEIDTWVAQRVGGIIVLPLDNNAIQPLIARAHKNDVKFLDFSDTALKGTDGWMIFDNAQAAQLDGIWLGHWINKHLHGKAKVGLLTHEVQETGRVRVHGAVTAMHKIAPGAKVVASHEGVLAAECLPAAQSMLQAHPDLNAFICIADDGALGVEKAFMQTHPSKARQRTMAIVGYDGSEPALEKLLAGSTIRATAVLDLIAAGAASVRATINAIEGKKPTRIKLPYALAAQDPAGMKVAHSALKKVKAVIG
jgi:ribose transport system substrate-binding protein